MNLISELTYANYRCNRLEYGMTAEAAATIYPNAEAMEKRLVSEIGQCDICDSLTDDLTETTVSGIETYVCADCRDRAIDAAELRAER